MKSAFAKQPNGDRAWDDKRTRLRYLITKEGGAVVAYIIDIGNASHPVRMATVPLQPRLTMVEVEKAVRDHADRIAQRISKSA